MRFRRAFLPALLAVGLLAAMSVPAVKADDFGLGSTAASAGIDQTKQLLPTIAQFLKIALSSVGILFLLLLIYAGFIYMTARGDSKRIGEAKNMMTGAVIGMVIIASAYAITSFVLGAVTGKATPAAPPPQTTTSDALKS